jgi:hypothetical protein
MARLIRALFAALALLAFSAPFAFGDAGASDYDRGGAPKVSSLAANGIFDSGGTVRASIDPNADDDWWWIGSTTYRFQLGATTAYATTTADGSLQPWLGKTNVSVPVSGLTPGTSYNYRAVATNAAGTSYGPNTTFKTTGKAPSSSTVSGSTVSGTAPEPELGHSVVAETTSGVVSVREQGSTDFHPLSDAESIPVNSTFDTSQGTVMLTAGAGGGESHTGAFHGGTFQVHQSPGGKGMTELVLRGGDFASCNPGPNARAASGHHLVLRKLWGKDHGGRFKTSGRGSVATVRGTEWYTADSCDGTLTRVTKGAVMVRERGTGRHELLHKGQSFFAHLNR